MEDSAGSTVGQVKRFTGGSFLGSLEDGLKLAASHISPIKHFLQQHVDHPIANKAVEIASRLGFGMTGAAKHRLADRLHK